MASRDLLVQIRPQQTQQNMTCPTKMYNIPEANSYPTSVVKALPNLLSSYHIVSQSHNNNKTGMRSNLFLHCRYHSTDRDLRKIHFIPFTNPQLVFSHLIISVRGQVRHLGRGTPLAPFTRRGSFALSFPDSSRLGSIFGVGAFPQTLFGESLGARHLP